MLTYNTRLERLVLPEYGRNIQRMVNHCKELADREERTACAWRIIEAMEVVAPPTGNREEYQRKLWDHLARMANYELDIDAPYPLEKPEEMDAQPDMLKVPANGFTNRHYGQRIQQLVAVASGMPEGDEREALALLIAEQMKKLLLALNRDGVDDAKVFADLARLSKGVIRLDASKVQLHKYNVVEQVMSKKMKKKLLEAYL